MFIFLTFNLGTVFGEQSTPNRSKTHFIIVNFSTHTNVRLLEHNVPISHNVFNVLICYFVGIA